MTDDDDDDDDDNDNDHDDDVVDDDGHVDHVDDESIGSFSHGSYNLEKVLNFSSRLEKSLNLVKSLKST